VGVRLRSFPEYGVAVQILDGTITSRDLIAHSHVVGEGPRRPKRVITYVDPDADLSGVALAAIPAIALAGAAAKTKLYGDEPITSIWICEPGANWSFVDFWREYSAVRGSHPTSPILLPNLQAAFDRLNLSDKACKAVTAAVGADKTARREVEPAPKTRPHRP
jgi:hypothetical protein